MKKKGEIIIGIFFLFLILFTNQIMAQQTQQFNKIFLEPFYRNSMDGDVDYTYELQVNPPDKITKVDSAIITFQMWLNPTIEFFLIVNGQQCNTPSYEVHTTYAGAGEGTIFFDCSNVITEAGTYTVVLTPDDDTGAITGWIDLTYTNSETPITKFFGTEYNYGQDGKVWLQLITENQTSYIDYAICYLKVYSPDNEVYIDNSIMNYLDEGIYYHDFLVPQQQGVYPVVSECFYEAEQSFESADAFEGLILKTEENDYTYTWLLDGDKHKLTELKVGGIARLNYTYTFNDGCWSNQSEELLNGMTVYWYGKWDSAVNDNMIISIYNFTSDSWYDLPNEIIKSGDQQGVSNSIELNNFTTAGLVNSTNDLVLKFEDSETIENKETKMENDFLYVSCDHLANPTWQEIKGSSELHITSEFNYEIINNAILYNRTEGYEGTISINFTVASGTKSLKDEQRIIYQLPQDILCSSIVNFTEANGTYQSINYISNWDASNHFCEVIFFQDLDVFTNYEFNIKIEDYINRRNLAHYGDYSLLDDMMSTGCMVYAMENNLTPYTIPLTSQPDTDKFYSTCAYYLDVSYLVNQTYFTIQNLDITSQDDLDNYIGLSKDYERLINLARGISDTLFEEWTMSDSYAWYVNQNPTQTPTYMQYWGNRTTPYQNYLLLVNNRTGSKNNLTAEDVWKYAVRNLTYYPVMEINETAIAEEVWSWSGSISSTILNYISENIWNYLSRNLTYYEVANVSNLTVNVNATEIANEVWSYEGTINNNILNQIAKKVQCYIEKYFIQEDREWGIEIPIC